MHDWDMHQFLKRRRGLGIAVKTNSENLLSSINQSLRSRIPNKATGPSMSTLQDSENGDSLLFFKYIILPASVNVSIKKRKRKIYSYKSYTKCKNTLFKITHRKIFEEEKMRSG